MNLPIPDLQKLKKKLEIGFLIHPNLKFENEILFCLLSLQMVFNGNVKNVSSEVFTM